MKKSWTSVRTKAGLPDVRFHDLRHTAATRLVAAHLPLPEVGRVLGHTQANTTYRYVNANIETTRRAAALLDAFNQGVEQLVASEETEGSDLVLDATVMLCVNCEGSFAIGSESASASSFNDTFLVFADGRGADNVQLTVGIIQSIEDRLHHLLHRQILSHSRSRARRPQSPRSPRRQCAPLAPANGDRSRD